MENKTPKSESVENESDELFNRIRNEPPLTTSGVSQPIEPSLDEARADLARAISKIAHSALSTKYGPLVGTIAETTAISVLKDLESNIYRAKGDFTLVAQELLDRAITSRTKKKK
ncbi:unannotated protein [freshwater metagenome]|uniref:Unannotated protein n=1 Tax=freshwater metagenome TaxID=449393 RepID=A0A6J6XZW5_9ZZZZ|nr:hypothetical protein [Actinomycetota bacterium]MSV87058.1 hypothetical protein [Actinomycetota bacterium]MSW67447.1 hypothetical protein [Actinomycetota bacterium]MSX28689.1 hypothetical protein [Actinomycetota bacterium]MSY04011.1 hypothetical protein [Actinomycetota bacterium]